MTTSDSIKELAAALAKAQAEMGHALKDSTNPHYKSAYADLQSVREAARPLSAHGLAFIQSCRMSQSDGQMVAEVETRLLHTSGEWMADTLAVPVSKPDAQGIGSALTYGRRYSLMSFAGIAPAEDDGESAIGRGNGHAAKPAKPEGFDDWWLDIQGAADMGSAALRSAWEQSPKDYRAYVTGTLAAGWTATKARAEKVAVPA